jgi:hypothetical protein
VKELGTIEEEAVECRKAFEGVEVGSPVWCCHHEKLTETLEEPAENRIRYILEEKSTKERAIRLREFRPVMDVELWKTLYADYQAKLAPLDADYQAKRDLLYDDYSAKLAPLDADYQAKLAPLDADYEAKRDLLYADYSAKRALLYAYLEVLHLAEYPDTAWNGKSIFGGAK